MAVIVEVIGRLTDVPEKKMTNNGQKYVRLSVAGNEGYGDNQETYFFSAQIFGKRAESVAEYGKGDLVRLAGHYYEYQSQSGRVYKELRYAEIELLQRKQSSNQQGWGQPAQQNNNQPQRAPQQNNQPQDQANNQGWNQPANDYTNIDPNDLPFD